MDGPQPRSLRHELRTPIHQIIGYAELISETAEDEGHDHYRPDLERIVRAARTLQDLVDRVVPPEAEGGGPSPAAAEAPLSEGGGQAVEEEAGPRPAAQEPFPSVAGAHLLVVDDDEANRDMLARRLERTGYRVATAADGPSALEALQRSPFDLVILDVMMPGMDGYEVLRRLRHDFSASDLPVVMATARDSTDDIVRGLRLGANDYVTKPLDFEVVLARVRTQLHARAAMEEVRRLAGSLEARNRFIRNTFGRFLSDEVVETLLESPGALSLGGESRTLSLLLADLRGFSHVAERLRPDQVVRVLNTFLGRMADVIARHEGTIDEFIGDAILVLFGAPIPRRDHARRAVACAAEMQCAMPEVNRRLEEDGLPTVQMGIGVNTGEVVVGNIGSSKRMKYGVVGSHVNLVSRIEACTVGGQVLISHATLSAVGLEARVGDRVLVQAKGFRDPVPAYDLRGLGDDLVLPQRVHSERTLDREVEVTVQRLLSKSSLGPPVGGALVAVGPTSALLRCESPLAALDDVRLLATGEHADWGPVYAKVVDVLGDEESLARVEFTSLTREAQAFVDRVSSGESVLDAP